MGELTGILNHGPDVYFFSYILALMHFGFIDYILSIIYYGLICYGLTHFGIISFVVHRRELLYFLLFLSYIHVLRQSKLIFNCNKINVPLIHTLQEFGLRANYKYTNSFPFKIASCVTYNKHNRLGK